MENTHISSSTYHIGAFKSLNSCSDPLPREDLMCNNARSYMARLIVVDARKVSTRSRTGLGILSLWGKDRRTGLS